MAIIYGLKVNLSMAIVPMVNQTAANSVHESHGKYTCKGLHLGLLLMSSQTLVYICHGSVY